MVEFMPEKSISPPPRKPSLELLTANHRDAFYTELVSREDSAYIAVAPIKRGTPYSTLKGAKQSVIDEHASRGGLYFLKEIKPGNSAQYGNTDIWVIWIWATVFLAESPANAEITYDSGAVAFPSYSRAYTIRRDTYEAAPTITPLSALTALIGVRITAGGTGYTAATATFGVAGSGALVEFVISGGAIIGAIVVTEGTGFTASSTITISGDGTGATAVCAVQPASCLLVAQKKQEFPSDSPLCHEFVQVLRRYMTLPGPEIARPGYNKEYGAATTDYRQHVALPGTAAVPGSVKNSQVVIDSYVEPDQESGSVFGTLFTECMAIPPTRIEVIESNYPLPAQFTFLSGWNFPPVPPLRVQGPFLGVNFDMTPHQRPYLSYVIINYYNGFPGAYGTAFSVTSPGAGSRFFPIDNNTIHDSVNLTETNGMSSQTVESFDASTPASYTPGDALLIAQPVRKVEGPIWEERLTYVQ